ncbi:PAS domain-containing hybrid sensor histidine kinase/response regulator [Balneola vulgaris]|uniref:PAS domain-containing hybrid sensor histidine kinase/response regulator n=1 Tax=Balneola vulgaris TaxID=287535 RepID=UPI0003804272|nr:response regulator [Balneola vulgaris]
MSYTDEYGITNKLLLRQLKKAYGEDKALPDELVILLHKVQSSYEHYDSDRALLERAMDLSSEEILESNVKLKVENEKQVKVLNTLKESLETLGIREFEALNTENISAVADYVKLQIEYRKKVTQALSESEKRYKLFVENATDIIYRVDKDGYFTYVNPVAYRLSGYTEQGLLAMKFINLVRDDYRDTVYNFYTTRIKKKESTNYLEFPLKTINGKELWIGQNVQILYRDGKYHGIQAVARDITKFKKVQRDLLEAKKQAEESSKAKEEFLANMSHEIRTPMNAIIGLTKLLNQTPLNPEQKKYVEATINSADYLISIINDILDFSKIEARKLDIEQVGFDMVKLVDDVFSTMHFRAEEKGILLQKELSKDLKSYFIGDPTRIKQILINLLSNAIKFTDRGSVKLEVHALNTKKNGKVVQFKVVDTGIGISNEKLTKIFESFSQADTSTTRKFGGTGLGLTITQLLVELLGGKILVQSAVGEGSEFSVNIPLSYADKEDLAEQPVYNVNTFDISTINLLLVEDHKINRLLIKSLLDQWRVKHDWAQNGEEALEKLTNDKFDIILMDVQMPVMDGIEATMAIRNQLKMDIPIIALTANAVKGDTDRCKEAGMNDYLTKPFDPSTLYNKIINQLLVNE